MSFLGQDVDKARLSSRTSLFLDRVDTNQILSVKVEPTIFLSGLQRVVGLMVQVIAKAHRAARVTTVDRPSPMVARF